MNTLGPIAVAALALTLAAQSNAEILLVDSFETGDMSATNDQGFRWDRNNRTSIVSSDEVVYSNGETSIQMPSGRDWETIDEEHSLRFRYPAGSDMAEQRFDLGGAYPEAWYKYWIRVPQNYTHSTSSPSNNKFFATWMDGYSSQGNGPTAFWNLMSNGSGGSSIAVSYSDGGYSVAGGQMQIQPFIRVPEDRGRWMQVVYRVKASSNSGTRDGEIELWRRWENENSFTQIHEVENALLPIPPEGPNGWNEGYIMGWANAPYSQDTEWLLDSFHVSTSSLLDESAADDSRPEPPTLTID
ncbi:MULTISPECIES: hypothetical protein [unclassified Marinobacter]|jgi:hypothetical protein|uniref:hypothetical protein n=1 Tax=unclassified Marinobacter TaxID=83889 RepID=UPI000C104F9A|nr:MULTISPECIES: hypothetical protein [unclassified Marinobacter]MAB50845.1 hypothetical protein [Marinobacter sp.]MBN15516.1 hypothetical protein [Pelagibacterium sp.]PHR86306.1 MAG: hypothetical protein COA80_19780 [Leeuwenhoekiella sp.]|tara:strand:+ start:1086 stop:1982 length:897 start_codon:yes stop_codon:yes gene_type:complete